MKAIPAPFMWAIRKAAAITGNKGRSIALLLQVVQKVRSTKWDQAQWQLIKTDLFTAGKMLREHATGRYRMRSSRLLLILSGALIYFVNPMDLIPDYLIVAGFVDDFAVLTWVFRAGQEEIKRFRVQYGMFAPEVIASYQ